MTRPMRIVVAGAYGLIGTYVTARLLAEGHEVTGVGRDIVMAHRKIPQARWVKADLARASVEDWIELLDGADAFVNCAGALQDSPRDDLKAVHLDAVTRLIAACKASGVKRFVHISAAGVSEGRGTAFNDTKLAAEAALKGCDLDWVILRPGLVIAPAAYGGTALLRALAATPLVTPVIYPHSVIQVVSGAETAEAVARAVRLDAPAGISADVVSAERLTLERVVTEIRRWLGLPTTVVWRLPGAFARPPALVADALAWFGWRSPMRTTSIEQLRMGVTGDAAPLRAAYGLETQTLGEMLRDNPSGVQERWFAKAYFLKPAMLGILALFWLVSGIVGATAGRDAAIAVLAPAHLPLGIAQGSVIGGDVIDILLGLAVIFRRTAGTALKGMILVSLAYLVGGTILRPDLWLDPLGPFTKVLPAAVLAFVALALLDER